MTILQQVKLLLGISDTSKDVMLQLMIDNSIVAFTQYCNREYADKYSNIIVKMVCNQYNAQQAEINSNGIKSESYSGISYTYATATDYNYLNDSEIVKLLNSVRRVGVL